MYLDVKYNGEREDLLKFYEKIYNAILEKRLFIDERLHKDSYFELFNPKNIRYIKILNGLYDNDLILVKFIKDVDIAKQNKLIERFKSFNRKDINDYGNYIKFIKDVGNAKQKELIERFKSFNRKDINYLNCQLGVAVVKQIILIYLERVKQGKNGIKVGEDGIYKTEPTPRYSIFLDRDFSESIRNTKIENLLKNEIMKYKNLKLDNVKFNFEPGDLLEFYKAIYNVVLKNKINNNFIKLEVQYDDLFKLFSPERLKDISLVNNYGINEILLEFKKDVEFSKYEFNNLQGLRFSNLDISNFNKLYYRCGLILLKKIVLIYLELAEKKKDKMEENIDEESKIGHEYKTFAMDFISDNPFFKNVESKVRAASSTAGGIRRFEVDGVEFNGTLEDLRKFYEKFYKMLVEEEVIENRLDLLRVIFDPENIKDIVVDKNGLNAVFNFDFTNIKKFCKKSRNEDGSLKIVNKIFENFDLTTKKEYYVIFPKLIINIYLEYVKYKEREKELYKQKEVKEEDKYKIIEINLYYEDKKFENIGSKMQPILMESAEGILFDNSCNDLQNFYKKAYNGLIKRKELIYDKFDPMCIIFNPENIENITVKDDGLNAVFKFNVKNIMSNTNANENKKDIMNETLNNFNAMTMYNVHLKYFKQIILFYIERTKDEEVKSQNIARQRLKYYEIPDVEKENKVKKEDLIYTISLKNKKEEKDKLDKLYKFEDKEFEMELASNNPNVENVRNKIKSIVDMNNMKDVLFNGSSKDLLKFYKEVFNNLCNANILILLSQDPQSILFSPDNIEDITVKDDGLNAVFKFNIENIIKQLKNGQYKKFMEFHINIVSEILNDFNKKTLSSYISIFSKQIILFYFECAENKKEEMKNFELENEKEENKLEEKKEIFKKDKNIENEKENQLYELGEIDTTSKNIFKEENANKEKLNKEEYEKEYEDIEKVKKENNEEDKK